MRKCFGIFAIPVLCLLATPGAAQKLLKTIEKRAKQKAEQRVIRRADQAMDKGMNEVEKGIEKEVKGDGNKEEKKEDKKTNDQPPLIPQQDPSPLFTSKYDFIPGEKVLVYEDFGRVGVGDFPAGWNTDAAAEVVTVANKEGKWLRIAKQGTYFPEMIKTVEDNMTLEFYVQTSVSKNNPSPFYVNIGYLANPADFTYHTRNIIWRNGQHGLQVQFVPGTQANGKTAVSFIKAGKGVNPDISNRTTFRTWDNAAATTAHIALWRQATRLRVYVNGEKVWDVPRAFENGSYNAVTFTIPRNNKDEYYLVSNIRMAVGSPDTRNKLLTEGKFVTHGILFDSGSDKIKPESYGILKEIAAILNEDASLKIKVVGHTDSDGDDQSNLSLSQRRAAAVKSVLSGHFGAKTENIETEGKGESEPAEKGNTPEAKAANRRVVFIRL